MLPRGGPLLGGDFSLLSWNVLAEQFSQEGIGAAIRYAHVPRDDLAWETRCRRIVHEVTIANPNVLCFQEVDLKVEASLRSPLETAGYTCLLQRKDDTKHPAVNATFWKAQDLELVQQIHRSRVLTTIFKDGRGRLLAVANCHLEGNPRETLARVKQLQSTLKQLEKVSHHGVILAGDFNCELQTSACASYLAFGVVLPGVVEWGAEVPDVTHEVPGHGYELSSAYPSNTSDFSFTLRGSSGFCGMLDQMWHTHGSLQLVGTRCLFESEEQKIAVLTSGLPSAVNPSDHLPIGAALRWTDEIRDLRRQDLPAVQDAGLAPADLLEEADLLLANCPWTDEQKAEWVVATTLPDLPKGQKPAPEQLAILKELRDRKERLLAELPEEACQILQRVLELQKKAKKAAAKAGLQ